MIIPMVLSPNIFKFSKEVTNDDMIKYANLTNLLANIQRQTLVILDKQGFLSAEIFQNIYNIVDDNIKLKLRLLFRSIENEHSQKLEIRNNFEGEIDQVCGIFLSLLNNNNNHIGIYAENILCAESSCQNCITKYTPNNSCVNITTFDNDALSKEINKSNIIIDNDYNIETFKNLILNPFIENTNTIIVYDEQISNLNKNASDIADNFKRNLHYWTDYFYSTNNNLSLKFYTTIKDIGNKYQTKRKLNELANEIRQKYNKNDFDIKIVSEKLHERYFCSDKFIFSCDKGIDIVNSSGALIENIHLSILEKEESNKIRTKIKSM